MFINKFEFLGNLTKDSELRDANGTPVLNFSLAVNRKRGDKETVFYANNISHFGAGASKLAEYMKSGKQVFAEGHVENAQYEKDGVTVNTYNFVASRVTLGSSPAAVSSESE